jgi:hypothetical protein
MNPAAVVIVNDDPTLQAQLDQCLADTDYAPLPQPAPAAAATQIAAAHPAAIVVKLPTQHPPQEEHALLAHLHDDPGSRQIPVVVCSDRPAVLQSAVQALQPRPGLVLASAPDAEELRAKLHVAQEATP